MAIKKNKISESDLKEPPKPKLIKLKSTERKKSIRPVILKVTKRREKEFPSLRLKIIGD